MPLSPARILPRPRVATALARAVAEYPLVAVVAPMGYGKTTAARELAEAVGGRTFSATIPPGPHNTRYLWNSVLGQFADQGLEIALTLRRLGFPTEPAQTRRVIDQCRGDTRPACLIFDDYQHVDDPALDAFFELLVREQLPGFHIALFSRTRPGMQLEELRFKGVAALFGSDLLAFTRDEAAAYFALHGCPGAAAAAWSYSEGWAAALWLCLESWRKGGTARPTRDAEALLAETVFSAYNERERALLMQASVLDSFTAEEAARLSGDAGAPRRLRGLHDKNAFLSHDPATDSYQLHSIFRSFLAKALGASAIDMPALRRRAGECLAARGELMPAVRFFSQAGRDEDLLRLLDVFALPGANLLLFFFPQEIMAMAKAVPWRLRERRPVEYLSFVYFCLVEAGDPTAVTLLEEAEERFARAKSVSGAVKRRLKGEILLIKSMLAFNDLWAMRDVHEEAHRLLNGRSAISNRRMIWTFGCPHASYLYLRRPGTYADMIELVEGHLHYFQDLTDGCSMGAERVFRAEWLLERDEPDRVASLLADADNRARSKDQLTTLLAAAFTRARLLAAAGRPAGALAALGEWQSAVQDADHVDLASCLDLAIGYMNACLGRLEAIPKWIREGSVDSPRNVVQMLGFIHAVHGKAALLAGEHERADAVARSIPVHLGPYCNLFGHIHAKAIEAAAARRLRGVDEALDPMRAAVDLARQDGIQLTLAEYGGHLLPLVLRLREEDPRDRYLAALAGLTERYARLAPADAGRKSAKVRLTPREEDSLKLLAKGKSNAEIAKRLGVAEITVKKTLTAAYAKLKARNRIEAAKKYAENSKIV